MGSLFWLPLRWKVYKYLMCIGSGLFSKLGAYRNAVGVARKHVVNWPELVLKAVSNLNGVFKSRAGGTIRCRAKTLLKQLVRLENVWHDYGDNLPIVKFDNASIVIPDYFGRDFSIPLRAEGISPPSSLIKEWPFNVNGEIVLDIGAYLGDTPLMWLYRSAKHVIAVEPVPEHFQYLQKNTSGLPVTCILASLAIQIPKIPELTYSMSYGVKEIQNPTDFLSTPVVTLTDLVSRYKPTVVKLNCEGCEHFVLNELINLPNYGVKHIAVSFHNMLNFSAYDSLRFIEQSLGKGVKTLDKGKRSKAGVNGRTIIVYWSM
jgi:FkbM family methyltransferase